MSSSVDNQTVTRLLNLIADMLEFKDENPFKIRSYRAAAQSVEDLREPVANVVARGGAAELQKIEGIGKTISAQILDIVQTGKSSYFESLTEDVPASVLDLRRVSGIGLKTAQILYHDFGIKSLDELKTFGEGGGLSSVPGVGEKTITRIKESLAWLQKNRTED